MMNNVNESALDFIELRFDRRIELAAGCLEKQRTRPEGRVCDNLDSAGEIETFHQLVDRGEARRISAELMDFALVQPFEGSFYEPSQGIGIDGELAVQDAAGNRHGETYQVFLSLAPQLRAARGEIADHLMQLGELNFELFLKQLASRFISFAATGGERFLNAAVGFCASRQQIGFEGCDLGT